MASRPSSIVSYNMSKIRSKGTEPERLLEHLMSTAGLEFEKQYIVEGKPDFAFPKERVAVFCDSGFWHGYNWARGGQDRVKVRRDFWIPKIERNIQRDHEVNRALAASGWRVLRFWDFEIKERPSMCINRIGKELTKRREEE